MAEQWATVKSQQQQQRQRPKEKVVVVAERKRAPPEYTDFPNRYSPLRDDVLPLASQGAYFLMLGDKRGTHKRALHRGCTGVISSTLKAQVQTFSEETPIIVMDLSECPVLMDDYEWPQTIMSVDSSYKYCTCSFARYIDEDDEVKCHFYSLRTPYYYLCNMNKPGREQILLAHEQMRRTSLLNNK